MIRRPPRSTHCISSAASDVYKRQVSTQSTWGNPPHPVQCRQHGRAPRNLARQPRMSRPVYIADSGLICARGETTSQVADALQSEKKKQTQSRKIRKNNKNQKQS
eukprot:TRINITY_DN7814_c0_g1_i2.p3 TRINITY_DN7814_c0_g1~~TRINITY_DN7814_c0_g1_i2.p3  ORF type:complete len:105 (-),score=25.65 TRINITY_DN7814_c0_g1_i2:54-368(-)